jgi:hypothetical protein
MKHRRVTDVHTHRRLGEQTKVSNQLCRIAAANGLIDAATLTSAMLASFSFPSERH